MPEYLVRVRMPEAEVGRLSAHDGGMRLDGLDVLAIEEVVPPGWTRNVYEADPWTYAVPQAEGAAR